MLMPFNIPGISKAKRYGINHHKSKQMTNKFDYYIDTKYTIWGRERYTIVAELKEKADEIMMDIFENGDTHGLCYDFEYNYETSEDLQPEDNGGECTKELYEEKGNLIITNQNK